MSVQLPTTITISLDNVGKNTNIYVAEKFTKKSKMSRKSFHFLSGEH